MNGQKKKKISEGFANLKKNYMKKSSLIFSGDLEVISRVIVCH